MLGSGVLVFRSSDECGDEGTEQGLSTSAGVMNELEEAEIDWELFLRDAAMGAQPGA